MTNINIRVDDDLKQRAETIFQELGFDITTATTVFLKQVIHVGGMPFEMRDPFYSEENQEHIRAAIARMDAGGGTEHPLNEPSRTKAR